MQPFHIFHCRLHAVVNSLWPRPQRFAEQMSLPVPQTIMQSLNFCSYDAFHKWKENFVKILKARSQCKTVVKQILSQSMVSFVTGSIPLLPTWLTDWQFVNFHIWYFTFASVNLPLHHKVQKFSSGTGSPWWSQKKGHKTVVVWWWYVFTLSSMFL